MRYSLYLPETNIPEILHIVTDTNIEFSDNTLRSGMRKLKLLTFHNFTSLAFVDAHNTLDIANYKRFAQMGFKYACIWEDGTIINDDTIDTILLQLLGDCSIRHSGIVTIYKLDSLNNPVVDYTLPDSVLKKINVVRDKNDHYYHKVSNTKFNTVFAGNNEPCFKYNKITTYDNNNIDMFIVPCSGLNQFSYIEPHLNTLKKVIFYDVNPHSIEWMKFLIDTWDGIESTRSLVDKFLKIYKHDVRFLFYDNIERTYFSIFKDVSPHIIETIRNAHVKFVLCDITTESYKITDMISTGDNVFINVSNIWHYESNFINGNHIETSLEFFKLVNNIDKKANVFYFRGQSPSCREISISNVRTIKGFV